MVRAHHLIFGGVAIVAACGGAVSSTTIAPPQDRGLEPEAPDASAESSAGPIVDNTGTCQYSCDTKADCCTDCTYPQNSECVGHRCAWLGCSGDADCQRAVPGMPSGSGVVCRVVGAVNRCVRACAKNEECIGGESCEGVDDKGELHCEVQRGGGANPCAIDDKTCWGCRSNDDCDGKHGVGSGVCSTVTHTCGCTIDTQCPSHYVCDHSIR
jgi:hypothetical protein